VVVFMDKLLTVCERFWRCRKHLAIGRLGSPTRNGLGAYCHLRQRACQSSEWTCRWTTGCPQLRV